MKELRQLPFATYDLAVYLPGGAVVLVIFLAVLDHWFPGNQFVPHLKFDKGTIGQIMKGVFWLAASYLSGHVSSFVSSYLIEKFIHNNIGYPSDIWIEAEQRYSEKQESEDHGLMHPIFENKIKNRKRGWVASVINITQAPVAFILLAFMCAKPFGFYTPKIPFGLLEKLKKKFEILDTGIEIRQGSRWDKILEHHVANRCPSAYSRMYNYLIIYGALRLISLIMLMILWIFIFNDLIIKIECLKLGYFFQCLSLKISLQYLIICSVYIMALMAFSKFNRRYFEESVLGFLFSDGDVAPVHQSPRASIV